ncbi:MAG: DUF1273 family protein [Oscillospiraceae bacterium]|nr:DUF1273 family protein [Oscillospiraceae bacterium]
MIDKNRTACFTGHRKIPAQDINKINILLDRIIEQLYQKGVIFYGAGGAYGFDMLAEEAVLRAKKRHNEIKLILVLPCKRQDKYWSAEDKYLYYKVLERADKIVYISEKYTKDCMMRRNRHLVNYSGYCIAYLLKDNGGTAYTGDFAQQNGLNIIILIDFC